MRNSILIIIFLLFNILLFADGPRATKTGVVKRIAINGSAGKEVNDSDGIVNGSEPGQINFVLNNDMKLKTKEGGEKPYDYFCIKPTDDAYYLYYSLLLISKTKNIPININYIKPNAIYNTYVKVVQIYTD